MFGQETLQSVAFEICDSVHRLVLAFVLNFEINAPLDMFLRRIVHRPEQHHSERASKLSENHGLCFFSPVQDRVFLFVFGGRDATYEDDELAYKNVSLLVLEGGLP